MIKTYQDTGAGKFGTKMVYGCNRTLIEKFIPLFKIRRNSVNPSHVILSLKLLDLTSFFPILQMNQYSLFNPP